MAERTTRFADYGDYHIDNPIAIVFESAPFFVNTARAMRNKNAVNHRGAIFGGIALMEDEGVQTAGYVGYNYTPWDGHPKRCAEMRSIGNGIAKGYNRQDLVLVTGSTDLEEIESILGFPSPTILPCAEKCRPLIGNSALVLAVGADVDIYQAHTGEELKGLDDLYLPNGKQKRRRFRKQPVPPPLVAIEDPEFAKFIELKEEYLHLSTELPSFDDLESKRMAQAELAVGLIRGLAPAM